MDLSLELLQKHVLGQQMQQSLEILQMNAITLSEYIQEIMEENPLLEYKEVQIEEKEDKFLRKLEWLEASDEQNSGYYRVEQEDEHERDDERFGKREGETLREYLQFQINIMKVDEASKDVMCFFADNIEESGYLKEDILLAAYERYNLDHDRLMKIRDCFQTLDPPGIGAADLQECILIQLEQKGASLLAMQLTRDYLEALAKNRLAFIAKELRISVDEVVYAFDEIKDCEPKPGGGFYTAEPVEYIVPDVMVEKEADGTSRVLLNSTAMPRVFISRKYINMLKEQTTEEEGDYLAQKLQQAEWVVQCIARRESTLLETAKCIAVWQDAFFSHLGGQLRPLRMADIAKKMDVHESTVSRAVKDKYLQCGRGVFPLSYFFSRALATEMHGEVSAESMRERIRYYIKSENKKKPFSDQELTELLQAEGTQISRRTVAKYRESAGICRASARKTY